MYFRNYIPPQGETPLCRRQYAFQLAVQHQRAAGSLAMLAAVRCA